MDTIRDILIIIFLIMLFVIIGCDEKAGTNCLYSYTDLDGNTGEMYFCKTHIGGGMTCSTGDYKYTVQVKEYHRVCEEA